MEERSWENSTRRRLLQTGAAAIPMMITIKAARAQVTGPGQEMLASIACLRNSAIPSDYRIALDEVAKVLGLQPTGEPLAPQGAVPERPGGWLGMEMSRSTPWTDKQAELSTQATEQGPANYRDWTYQDFQDFFYEGQADFYSGVVYDPGSQYHNTFLEITMSTACWNSIQTQLT